MMGHKIQFRHRLTGSPLFDILISFNLAPISLWGCNEFITLLGRSVGARARTRRPQMPEIGYLSSRSKAILMHATSFAVRLLLSFGCAVLAAPAVSEDTGVGPPPALAPGQAPPLPKPGPLAEPRSSDQVGFPTALDPVCHLADHAQACQSRIGSEAVLRASALRGRHRRLRHLPRSGARLHRRQARVSRHPWPRRPTQRPNHS